MGLQERREHVDWAPLGWSWTRSVLREHSSCWNHLRPFSLRVKGSAGLKENPFEMCVLWMAGPQHQPYRSTNLLVCTAGYYRQKPVMCMGELTILLSRASRLCKGRAWRQMPFEWSGAVEFKASSASTVWGWGREGCAEAVALPLGCAPPAGCLAGEELCWDLIACCYDFYIQP